MQRLPFGDDTFDETIAMWSIIYIRTGRDLVLPEMLRVTKPGGNVRIFPLFDTGKPESSLDKVKFIEYSPMSYTVVLNKDPHVPVDAYLSQVSSFFWTD